MKNRPGPLAPWTRPRRKTTPRSYSCTMRMPKKAMMNAASRATPTKHKIVDIADAMGLVSSY